MSEYDISRAFNRIENDLMDSMMRNLKRHQAEENELGIKWEQWQVLQLKELERYRKENADKFTKDFAQINRRIDTLFRTTSKDAQAQEEAKILDLIKKGQFTPTERKDVRFFGVNDDKLNVLIERTKADFTKAEYAVLRKSNDAYRQIIFDAQVYGNVTNDYAKAVDMATHDYLMHGYQSIVYKNGARHNISNYARMAIRTGNKRAYLMGEGNARDEFGIHTIRVNKRTQACPKCVGFLGKVLIDDVYANGTRAEADELGVPTLSDAIDAGFLHPNCKDIYSMYIPDVSKPAEPWTRTEIQQLVGRYNKEQEIERALDMAFCYERMARYSLSPDNQTKYQARADQWQSRVNELRGEPITEQQVELPPIVEASQVHEFTKDEKEAIEWYVSGDGMWINQYLRGRGDFGELSNTEQQMLDLLKSATDRPLDPSITKLYRSVDASAIFGNLSDMERDNLYNVIVYGDSYVRDYKQQPLERKIKSAIGKTLEEKGFMSTTLDKDIAVNFGDFTDSQNPIVLELDTAKAKLKGADLQAWDIEDDPQKEILLHTGTKYKITDVGVGRYPEGGKYLLVKAEAADDVAKA